MGVNPTEYDPAELRELAGIAEPEVRDRSEPESPGADESIRAQQFRDLLSLRASRAAAGLDRPYLRSIPSTDLGRQVLVDWLEFLVLVGGHDRARDTLEYYREIGWVSEGVERQLSRIAIELPQPVHERSFEITDHRLSLLYVATLSSIE